MVIAIVSKWHRLPSTMASGFKNRNFLKWPKKLQYKLKLGRTVLDT
jgi:hypothetical protein